MYILYCVCNQKTFIEHNLPKHSKEKKIASSIRSTFFPNLSSVLNFVNSDFNVYIEKQHSLCSVGKRQENGTAKSQNLTGQPLLSNSF